MSTVDTDFSGRLEQAHRAVRHWATFPVRALPRPLVLAGPEILVRKGFRTGAAKDAFVQGRLQWAVEVPEDVRAKLQPKSVTGLRDPGGQPLKITHAGNAEHAFSTDRGPMTLPAWWLQGPATVGAIWILDPTVDHWQAPAGGAGQPPAPTQTQPILGPIELAADGQSVVVRWLGSAAPIETYAEATVIETETAVSAVVRVAAGFHGWATAAGVTHRVPARLRRPLGNRVFVDLHGSAVPVTSSICDVSVRLCVLVSTRSPPLSRPPWHALCERW